MKIKYIYYQLRKILSIFRYRKANRTVTIPYNFPLELTELSDYIHIEPDFHILGKGKVKIGSNVVIARGFRGITTLHQSQSVCDDMLPYNGSNDRISDIIIEDNVWIGSSVTIMAGIIIEEGAIIGAGSIVTKNVEKGHIVAGVPAKTIKVRNLEEYEMLKKENRLYLPAKYNKSGKV